MTRKAKLLQQHLEDVSWKVLAEYPELFRELIRGRCGVYALYRRGKLYYVGLASNLRGRLKTHLRDSHKGAWDRFSVYLTADDRQIRELESLLVRIAGPEGNKQRGRFSGSVNLMPRVNRKMREVDADRRARLLGGSVARRRKRVKTSKTRGSRPLAGVLEGRLALKAWHKGKEMKATLRKDGKTSYRSRLYDSPSGAARAVVRHACNGWFFWHYKDKKGDWIPLENLKK